MRFPSDAQRKARQEAEAKAPIERKQQIDRERERGDSLLQLRGIQAAKRPLTKVVKGKRHAATMVVLLSDVHCEERVDPRTVNGLNDFSLDVGQARLDELQERFFRLLEHERQLADIDRLDFQARLAHLESHSTGLLLLLGTHSQALSTASSRLFVLETVPTPPAPPSTPAIRGPPPQGCLGLL